MNPLLLLLIVPLVLAAGVVAGFVLVGKSLGREVGLYALALAEAIREMPAHLAARQRLSLVERTAELEKVSAISKKAKDPSYKLTEADVDTLIDVIAGGAR